MCSIISPRQRRCRTMASSREGLIARAVDRIFGCDFVISYSHGDEMRLPRRIKRHVAKAPALDGLRKNCSDPQDVKTAPQLETPHGAYLHIPFEP